MSTIYAVNATSLAPSEYTLEASDVVSHNNELCLLQSDQLVSLDLTVTESGITAEVETGILNLGSDEKKYIPEFKATLSGDSKTEVWVTIELDGDSIEMGPYELVGRSGPRPFTRRWKLSNGVKADSVSLRFEGTEGTAWKLQGLLITAELV